MNSRDKLAFVISTVEKELEKDKLNFSAMETQLADSDMRMVLLHDALLHDKFSTLYLKMIGTLSQQLTLISRRRLNAIPESEFIYMGNTKPQQTPNYKLFIENFESISLFVKTDLLECESVLQATIAYQRWAEVAMHVTCAFDYNSGMAIHAAINCSKFSKHQGERTKNQIAILDRIYDLKFTALRDVIMGQCVPHLGIFSNFFRRNAEALELFKMAGDEKMQPTKSAEAAALVRQFTQTILGLQRNNDELIDLELVGNKNNNTPDTAMFANRELLIARLVEMATLLKVPVPANKGTDEVIELLHKLAEKRTQHTIVTDDFEQANKLFALLLVNSTAKLPDMQVKYEHTLKELRDYIETAPKQGNKEGKERRDTIKIFINDLTAKTVLRDKIIFVATEVQTQNSRNKFSFLKKASDGQQTPLPRKVINYYERIQSLLEAWSALEIQRIGFARTQQAKVHFNQRVCTIVYSTIVTPLLFRKTDALLDSRPPVSNDKICPDTLAPSKPSRQSSDSSVFDIRTLALPATFKREASDPSMVPDRRSSQRSGGSSPSSPTTAKTRPYLLFRARSGSQSSSTPGTPNPSSPTGSRQDSPKSLADLSPGHGSGIRRDRLTALSPALSPLDTPTTLSPPDSPSYSSIHRINDALQSRNTSTPVELLPPDVHILQETPPATPSPTPSPIPALRESQTLANPSAAKLSLVGKKAWNLNAMMATPPLPDIHHQEQESDIQRPPLRTP